MAADEISSSAWLAWSQVLASFLIQLCTLGLSNSFGVFQSYFEHNILDSFSPSNIAWIGTTQGFLSSIFGIVSGPLYDKGYIRSLMYLGGALNVAGLLCTSFAGQYHWIILSYGIATGLGSGALYVPSQAAVQTYFSPEKASLPTGISMTGSSVGGIIYPILFRQLENSIGFSWTCRTFALINGVFLLTSCLLIKPRQSQQLERNISSRSVNSDVFYDWKLIILGVCALILNIGVDVPFYFVPTFVQMKLGLFAEVGDSLLAGINASSLLGRIFFNWISGYSTALITWQFSIFGACVLLFCWWIVRTLAGIIVFVILYGFLVGGLISLIPSTVRELNPHSEIIGARIGLVEGFQGVGFLIGPPIAGAIMVTSAGYFGVSMFCGALYFFLFTLVGILTYRRSKSSEEYDNENLELSNTREAPSA
ncbi:MFS general substrate transporter [Daldinia caldariorum]|uniref:MFS general substrate transporter n=1 Tax=Daldinia caldariorum TaxID=326644 RepID=UPI002007AF5A|nr:MFS general substrate transporter [Daldinia caldariorum]KAI1472936.1 MFS general substrate transporter [Daldinia caldariorum]